MFLEKMKTTGEEEEEQIEEEGEEQGENQQKEGQNMQLNPLVTPTKVIDLTCGLPRILARIQGLPEHQLRNTHWTAPDLHRRMKEYN